MNAATYGALMDAAAAHLAEGRRQVEGHRFDGKEHASLTVAAYLDLLDAARRHAWALISPARVAGVRASAHPHPVEAAALTMVDALPPAPGDAPITDEGPRRQRSWAVARTHIRAASDLIASHVTIDGSGWTPDAALVWDDVARQGALGRLGGMTATLLATQDALALRAGQAGLRWSQIGRWLPPADRAHRAALDVVRTAEVTGATTIELDGLSPASTTIRAATAVDELAERVARIRRAAWDLRQHPDYSTATLVDIAQAGLHLSVHTAAFHGLDLHAHALPAGDLQVGRARAWLDLLTDLRTYADTAPRSQDVHSDLVAVRRLLTALVPRGSVNGDRGLSARAVERALGGTLHAGCAALAESASWCSASFNRLAQAGHLWVSVRSLSGEALSEDASLAEAKLVGGTTLARASRDHVDGTLSRFSAAVATAVQPSFRRSPASSLASSSRDSWGEHAQPMAIALP